MTALPRECFSPERALRLPPLPSSDLTGSVRVRKESRHYQVQTAAASPQKITPLLAAPHACAPDRSRCGSKHFGSR